MAPVADRISEGFARSRLRRLLLAFMLLCFCVPLPLTLFLQLPLPGWLARGLSAPPLVSARPPPSFPELGLETLRSRDFQDGFQAWFASRVEPRGWTVRLTNQLLFSLFDRTYMNNAKIVLGRAGNLFEYSYLRSYCGRLTDDAKLASIVRQIGLLADRLRRTNQVLVFLITPSKAMTMPEFLPADLCLPTPELADMPARFEELLRQAGVPVVNGVELARVAKAADPLPPFPPGGIHWSRLLSLRAASLLLAEIGRAGGADVGGLEIGPARWDATPAGTDRDLAELLNLLRPPVDYQVGTAEPTCRPAPAGRKPPLVAVGGSFLNEILMAFSACRLFASIEQYFYYTRLRMRYPDRMQESVERATLDWGVLLAPPTVLVLELNASRIDGVNWMVDFLEDALAQLDESKIGSD